MSQPCYTEEELLMLSGIQHFCFCAKQWHLIHVEQLWCDNFLTAKGQILHQRVNDPHQTEKRRDIITLRSVPLASYRLGLYGVSDAVELHPSSDLNHYFTHPKYPGQWQAIPIEYKRGRPKQHNADKVQLCAEALCLEEEYNIEIPYGYLYYGETKHRLEVELTVELRGETESIARAMHEAFESTHPLKPHFGRYCKSCSLFDLCLPKQFEEDKTKDYLKNHQIFSPL